MKLSRTNWIFFILINSILSLAPLNSLATEFDAIVVPSLMDSGMDGWYKIPPNSGPNIHRASSVYQGQMFNLIIFFRGYAADQDNNSNISYDVQVYDPQGKPTEDKGTDLLAYQGPMGNPQALMLNQQFLKIVFTENYQLGTYKIKVTAYDKISGKTFTSETPIELIPFELPEKFTSLQEIERWMMGYYLNPTPVKAISSVLSLVSPDPEWINDNLSILTFFRRIFSDNTFVFAGIAKHFDTFSTEDQKKLLLISAISGDTLLLSSVTEHSKAELEKFYNSARKIEFPDVNGEIYSAVQLDILWSEFLATGKYDPINKIVSALALNKYKGNLEKIKTGEVEITDDIERAAYLEAVYGSAVWSLASNCKQMPLVFKYCAFMYEYENLDNDIKNQLGAILHVAQKELQENNEDK